MRRVLTLDLALDGGGSKGIALNAALAEILARGHRIRRLVGTSAGAIAAALVTAGFSGEELVAMSLDRTDDGQPLFSEYLSEPFVPVSAEAEPSITEVQLAALRLPGDLGRKLMTARAALSFLETGGFVSGEGFTGWLMRQLEGKRPGLSRITLGALFEQTGRHLTLVVTDTTARRLRALNHLSAPSCPLVSAVRMSMSIPLLFAEVHWRAEWGLYAGEDLTGHVMVDGGLLSNLPLGFILPTANALVGQLMGPPPEGLAFPVGVMLDTTVEVPGAPPLEASSSFSGLLASSRLGQRLSVLADTIAHGLDLTIADTVPHALCRLPAKGYRATEFDMSLARAEALVRAGRAATATYFDALEARAGQRG